MLIGGLTVSILGTAIGFLEDWNRGLVLLGIGILREWTVAQNAVASFWLPETRLAPRPPRASSFAVCSPVIIPGSFASWMLYGAYNRWPGYSYDQVPSYDN